MKYVQLQADRGKLPDGKQWLSAENVTEREKPQQLAAPRLHAARPSVATLHLIATFLFVPINYKVLSP